MSFHIVEGHVNNLLVTLPMGTHVQKATCCSQMARNTSLAYAAMYTGPEDSFEPPSA